MTPRTWMSRSMTLCLLAACVTLAAGCVTTENVHRPKEGVPTGPIAQVHATWENRIMVTQDVVHNGDPLIGIAGRMYLFGQEVGHPVQGEGMAIIELHDATNTHVKPVLLERWEIDRATLTRLLKKDTIGWGYTLFLPWSTHRPDITRVQMQVRYVPEKGLPLFSPPAMVSVRNDTQVNITQRRVLPGHAAPAIAQTPTTQSPPAVQSPLRTVLTPATK